MANESDPSERVNVERLVGAVRDLTATVEKLYLSHLGHEFVIREILWHISEEKDANTEFITSRLKMLMSNEEKLTAVYNYGEGAKPSEFGPDAPTIIWESPYKVRPENE